MEYQQCINNPMFHFDMPHLVQVEASY